MATIPLVTYEQQVVSLTQAVTDANQQNKSALQAALGIGAGTGTGAFRAYNNGAQIPSFTRTALASWQVPRDGTVMVSFNWWGMTTSQQRTLASISRIRKNATEWICSAPGIYQRKEINPEAVNSLVGGGVVALWLPVVTGDTIYGVAEFIGDDRVNGVVAYQAAGHGTDGLSVCYVA